MKPKTINELYHTLVRQNLVGADKIRASFTLRRSPGRGIVCHLLLDYQDLTSPLISYSDYRYAYAASVVFPQCLEGTQYETIVRDSVRRYGRTQKAELYGAAVMLSSYTGYLVYKDDDVLERMRDPELSGRDADRINSALAKAFHSIGLMQVAEPVEALLKQVYDSVLAEVQMELGYIPPLEMHPSREGHQDAA